MIACISPEYVFSGWYFCDISIGIGPIDYVMLSLLLFTVLRQMSSKINIFYCEENECLPRNERGYHPKFHYYFYLNSLIEIWLRTYLIEIRLHPTFYLFCFYVTKVYKNDIIAVFKYVFLYTIINIFSIKYLSLKQFFYLILSDNSRFFRNSKVFSTDLYKCEIISRPN